MSEFNYYHVIQPIFHLSDNKIHGFEALLRSSPKQNPEKLFQLAEAENKLFQLDMHSIFLACDMFYEQKALSDACFLYVNIYPSTLLNPNFYDELKTLKSKMKFRSASIVLEINEAEKMVHANVLSEIIEELKNQGFLIAIDDFGKGSSSLRSIVELEPNIIKIDRYFANNLHREPKKQQLIKLILEFTSEDSILILEGIETEEELQTAKKLGVHFAQGYLLGKPEPVDHYLEYI